MYTCVYIYIYIHTIIYSYELYITIERRDSENNEHTVGPMYRTSSNHSMHNVQQRSRWEKSHQGGGLGLRVLAKCGDTK